MNNYKEIQYKLYEKLKPSGWSDVLKLFILSDEFKSILEELYKQAVDNKRFTPVLKDIFRSFEECPYKDLKVVIIGQDPYPQAGIADGISFSCSKTNKVQPSLRYLFKEIEDTVYPNGYTWDPDLKRWSNQGVLMLNTALTCEINKIGSHIELWKPFIHYLLSALNEYCAGICYVFLGNKAKEWNKLIEPCNFKFFTTHPASAAYKKSNTWDSGNVFNQLNVVIEKQYGPKEKIIW
jgi:uracil-DNA glycosylase